MILFITHARTYMYEFAHLKNKIENYSTSEGALYQSEWVKINSSWIFFIFFLFMCVAANASELFCMARLANIKSFLYYSNLSF